MKSILATATFLLAALLSCSDLALGQTKAKATPRKIKLTLEYNANRPPTAEEKTDGPIITKGLDARVADFEKATDKQLLQLHIVITPDFVDNPQEKEIVISSRELGLSPELGLVFQIGYKTYPTLRERVEEAFGCILQLVDLQNDLAAPHSPKLRRKALPKTSPPLLSPNGAGVAVFNLPNLV